MTRMDVWEQRTGEVASDAKSFRLIGSRAMLGLPPRESFSASQQLQQEGGNLACVGSENVSFESRRSVP